jgi:hypothetical protein
MRSGAKAMDESHEGVALGEWRIAGADLRTAGGLALGLSVLYLVTRLQVHNQCVDCARYALTIREGEPLHLFQGAHLIYMWLLSCMYKLSLTVLPGTTAFKTAQTFNGVMASLAVAEFFLLARCVGIRRGLSLCLSLGLAFSYTFWSLVTDAEVHAPALFFMLLSLLAVLHAGSGPQTGHVILLGILSGLSVLFHVFAAFSVFAVTTLFLMGPIGGHDSRERARARQGLGVLIYWMTAGICVGGAYFLVMTRVLHLHGIKESIAWIFSFQNATGIADRFGLPVVQSVALSGIAIVRAFLGILSWLATPGFGDWLRATFAERCMGEELYLTRNVTPLAASLVTAAGGTAAVTLIALGATCLKGLWSSLLRGSRVVIAIVLWLVLYGVLLVVAAPESAEHWAFYWLPMLLMAIGVGITEGGNWVGGGRGFVRMLAGGLVVSLLAANLPNILLQHDVQNDLYLHELTWYQFNTGSEDLIVSAGGYKWGSYLQYFLPANIELLDRELRLMKSDAVIQQIYGKVGEAHLAGGRVFVMEDVLAPPTCEATIGHWDLAGIANIGRQLGHSLTCRRFDDVEICELSG